MKASKAVRMQPIERDPNRPAIERDLAIGRPMRQVARKYGRSEDAIKRFRDRMPLQLRAAIAASLLKPGTEDYEKLRVEEAEGILTTLAGQRARLLVMQDEAMEGGDLGVANSISRTIHTSVELTGRYLGEFALHTVSTSVSILASEDYLRVRQAMQAALSPFPEARRAVAAALHRVESETAQRLLDKSRQGVVIDQQPSDAAFIAAAASNGAAGAS